jgi:hypothetical protein
VAVLVVIAALLLAAAVIALLASPLRGARETPDPAAGEREELESRREAKYREIRDAELDYRTGKLSREDYEAIDATLRSEALEVLDSLSRHEAGEHEAEET